MRKLFFVIFAFLLLIVAECSKPSSPEGGQEQKEEQTQEQDPSSEPTQEPEEKPTPPPSGGDEPEPPTPPTETNYFKAEVKDVYAYNAGAITGSEVYYKTDIKDWTIVSSESWCKIEVESSRFLILPSEYKPTQKPNGEGGWLYTEPRKCTVTITAGTAYTKTFTVIQESMTMISVPFQPVLLNASGGSSDVLVINNCYGWKATTDANWITLTKKDASTLIVSSNARPASQTSPRKATVTLVSDLDDWVKTTFTVADADAALSGEDYNYGEQTDWD